MLKKDVNLRNKVLRKKALKQSREMKKAIDSRLLKPFLREAKRIGFEDKESLLQLFNHVFNSTKEEMHYDLKKTRLKNNSLKDFSFKFAKELEALRKRKHG